MVTSSLPGGQQNRSYDVAVVSGRDRGLDTASGQRGGLDEPLEWEAALVRDLSRTPPMIAGRDLAVDLLLLW
jgi:hypothetical protein